MVARWCEQLAITLTLDAQTIKECGQIIKVQRAMHRFVLEVFIGTFFIEFLGILTLFAENTDILTTAFATGCVYSLYSSAYFYISAKSIRIRSGIFDPLLAVIFSLTPDFLGIRAHSSSSLLSFRRSLVFIAAQTFGTLLAFVALQFIFLNGTAVAAFNRILPTYNVESNGFFRLFLLHFLIVCGFYVATIEAFSQQLMKIREKNDRTPSPTKTYGESIQQSVDFSRTLSVIITSAFGVMTGLSALAGTGISMTPLRLLFAYAFTRNQEVLVSDAPRHDIGFSILAIVAAQAAATVFAPFILRNGRSLRFYTNEDGTLVDARLR